jgi:alpha-tubulin suppressor-like RCC1 family protein
VKLVACGWDFVVTLTEEAELYVWGANKSHELGVVTENSIANTPTPFPFDLPEISLAGGPTPWF